MVYIDQNGNVVGPDEKKAVSLKERIRKIDPEYKAKVQKYKWGIPNFTKTNSPLYDSVTKIMFVLTGLLQWPPTREALRLCAHNQTFLKQPIIRIKDEFEFLTYRLEEKFPNCSKKISNLINEFEKFYEEYCIHLIRSPRLYLLPPEPWTDLRNYEGFLQWRTQEIMWATFEKRNAQDTEDTINGLTCTYPADIIKIFAEIYKELEKPWKILGEQKNKAKKQKGKGRPKITGDEEKIRKAIVNGWARAKGAGISLCDYLDDINEMGIEIDGKRHETKNKLNEKIFRTYTGWNNKRNERKLSRK